MLYLLHVASLMEKKKILINFRNLNPQMGGFFVFSGFFLSDTPSPKNTECVDMCVFCV